MSQSRLNPETFLPLMPAAFQILIALSDGEKHGYAIMREVADTTGNKIRLGPATLYGSIHRLLESGLIAEREGSRSAGSDDRRRRYYRLTDLGRRVAQAEAERLSELVRRARGKKLLRKPGLA